MIRVLALSEDFERHGTDLRVAVLSGKATARLATKPTPRCPDKLNQMRDIFVIEPLHVAERDFQRQPGTQQKMTRALQVQASLKREPSPPQPNRVQPAHSSGVAVRDDKRKDVLANRGLAANHRVTSETHMLMDSDFAR